jgi:putative transcriptional regulator
MKRSALVTFLGVVMYAAAGLARAADLSEPVFLVATPLLDGSPFAQSVVIAAPLPNGKYIGFIVNRPAGLTLSELFPDDAVASQVHERVYVGGLELVPGVFALARKVSQGMGNVVPLMPGLVAAIDGNGVDRVIASAPSEARYFVGLMLWDDEDLYAQIKARAWEVRPADVESVFRANGLWNSLRSPSAAAFDASTHLG